MIHLLSSSAFIICNKALAKKLGLKATILLSDLISKAEYFDQEGFGLKDGYFFSTQEHIENDTTLTPYQQRGAIKVLKDCGLIETKLVGIPARLHYKVIEKQVIKFLNNKSSVNLKPINNNKQIISNKPIIKDKKVKFENLVFSLNYPTAMSKDFISYWTEKNEGGRKMKFEKQKTFDVKRRLERWQKNEDKWARPKYAKKNTIKSKLETFDRAKKIMDKINGI